MSAKVVDRREQRQRRREKRRRIVGISLAVIVVVTVATIAARSSSLATRGLSGRSVNASFSASASPLTRAAIVKFAQGQVGYSTSPSNTYCNVFSAFWVSGPADCGNSSRDEQWCADFAAWTWRMAGVPVVYQYINGDLNSSSASFYEWGVRHHTWHSVNSSYVPQAGDVAVYGLDTKALVAQHVAVVVDFTPGSAGPDAINGDGNHTGFSRVEYQANELNADASGSGTAPLAGYVSPGA